MDCTDHTDKFMKAQILIWIVMVGVTPQVKLFGAEPTLREKLAKLDARVAAEGELETMLARDIRVRVRAAHRESYRLGEKLDSREKWEGFRDERIAALRRSLGSWPEGGQAPHVENAGTLESEDHRVERLVIEGRLGLPITANLYLPKKPGKKLPVLILCHSFFHPKSQAELQTIGVRGARAGCAVLVLDLLGHGERRQHGFADAKSYPEKFNVPRQDYYSRAVLGLQLDVIGESLMGWMAWDVSRCVDMLQARPEIDREKIVVLGAVAAGGDVAAVAAALDRRIAGVVPYNFGGPEPETVYPLPEEEPELTFPYASGGHWDSTRRLRHSARDGFLPWVVVGSVAPRRLVHAHEFAWDEKRDAAWHQLERIYRLYDAPKNLTAAFGKGTLFGKTEGTGCGNIGDYHMGTLRTPLRKWFGIDWPEKGEPVTQRKPEELFCLTPELREKFKVRPLHETVRAVAVAEKRGALRDNWAKILGDVEPARDPKVKVASKETLGAIAVERCLLEVERGVKLPVLLLVPAHKEGKRAPVVLVVGQQGKQEILARRASDVAALLEGDVAVCLVDVRGTGESRPKGERRGRAAGFLAEMQRNSQSVLLSNELQMLGQTLVGERVRDVRSVLRYLGSRKNLDRQRVAIWGDSFAPTNDPKRNLIVPFDAPQYPEPAEPLGAMLALLTGLFEEDVMAVALRGGPTGYSALVDNATCHVPADFVVPGAVAVGDLEQVAAALAPRRVFAGEFVDGLNRRVEAEGVRRDWKNVKEATIAGIVKEGEMSHWLLHVLVGGE